ncbi:asparagine synthase (glutamine-hydrolyzing) [Candidatus Woesearchaeota archaeon]|nr:asparagine synthase (glutamine-hydrolyzing) [Candidatus Woesearchaeota archaeon]
MCGIVGFNWDDKSLARRMSSVISYRGPDDSGIFTDRNVSLAHQRLSILDLSKKGHQPMANEDGSIQIVYNGEIYNFQTVKAELEEKGHRFVSDTDTEVIVHAYEEYGLDCLKMFNGMFAFCIYDSNKKILFLARDWLGIKPLYYYSKDGNFIFSSELKAILEHEISREVEHKALNKFLAFRYNTDESTMMKDVLKLMQGHYAIYDLSKKELSIKRWWDINIDIQNKSEDYFARKLHDTLKESVRKRLISDVPLGVYLSGGIDSSSIVAMMKELGADVKSFSVDFGNDRRIEDIKYARKVAEYFNTDHKEIYCEPSVKELPRICWHLDEPLADPAVIPSYLLSRLVKKHVSVVLNGAGGDEIFGGYQHFDFLKHRGKFNLMPKQLKKSLLPLAVRATPDFLVERFSKFLTAFGEKGAEKFVDFISSSGNKAEFYLAIISVMDEEERKNLIRKDFDVSLIEKYRKKYFRSKHSYMDQVMYLESNHFLVDNIFNHVDKTTMAWAVESRVPICDHEVVSLAFRIPNKMKLKGQGGKYIFKRAMNDSLPKDVLTRKKQGFFVPIDRWIEKDIKESVESLLSEKEVSKHGLFNQYQIKKMFDGFSRSKMYYARQMWTLMNFQIWHKIYIQGERPESINI